MHVLLGHDDELGERAVARAAQDLEVRPAHLAPVAPEERRVDHDLLARVTAHPGAVGAGHEGERVRVGTAGDEQVAAVQRRRP
jgi:hypothetical protein